MKVQKDVLRWKAARWGAFALTLFLTCEGIALIFG